MKYRHTKQIEEFRKRFPTVPEMFTTPAKGELTDIEQFLDEQLSKKEEEVKKEFERFRNNLVTEDMNRELEEQLKTQTKK